MDRKNVLAAMCISLVLLSGCADKTASDGTGSASQGSNASQSQALRPGDEGFTFQYALPEDWEPETFPEDNAAKIVAYMKEIDEARFVDGTSTPFCDLGPFYIAWEPRQEFAAIPTDDFWNKNPDMPQDLYQLPVNSSTLINDFRIVGGREFAELNGDLIPYYMEAARHISQTALGFSRDTLDQSMEDGMYYAYPQGDIKDTFFYSDIENYRNLQGWIQGDYSFITDDSLCYLGSDGRIRVRGMLLYDEEYEGGVHEYGKVYTDIVMDVIPEALKSQPWDWEFGDFSYRVHSDIIRPEIITEETYNALLEQYHVTFEEMERPEWMGVYGGK